MLKQPLSRQVMDDDERKEYPHGVIVRRAGLLVLQSARLFIGDQPAAHKPNVSHPQRHRQQSSRPAHLVAQGRQNSRNLYQYHSIRHLQLLKFITMDSTRRVLRSGNGQLKLPSDHDNPSGGGAHTALKFTRARLTTQQATQPAT